MSSWSQGSRPGRRLRWLTRLGAVAATVLLASTALGQGSASAKSNDGFPGGTPTVPPGSTVEVVHRCVVYANPAGFGYDCASGGERDTIASILHGEKFPECRYELLSPSVIDDLVFDPNDHPSGEGFWYLETCLKGIHDDGTGDFTRVVQAKWFSIDKPPPTLTQNQGLAWRQFRTVYPQPRLGIGPGQVPRALIPTSFFLNEGTGDPIEKTVFDGVRNVPMRAKVAALHVRTGARETPDPLPPCLHATPYFPPKGPFDQDTDCQYVYPHSSASYPDQHELVTLVADWIVQYQLPDGTWKQVGQPFPQTQAFPVPVQEIQSIAQTVPFSG